MKTVISILVGLIASTSLQAGQDDHDTKKQVASSQVEVHVIGNDHDNHDEHDHAAEARDSTNHVDALTDEDEESDHGHDKHAETSVKLSPQQLRLGNISIDELHPRILNSRIYAPGEIKSNGYTSYLVSPRVESVVLKRHAALGDQVATGDSLVTLFSESVAEAQANYRIAALEWRRQQQLEKATVSDKDRVTAQTQAVAAYGRLVAYGLSKEDIKALEVPQGDWKAKLGEYTLYAEHDGAVLTDDFHQGQRVEAGTALMELANESELWVEARLAPNSTLKLPKGMQAEIMVGSENFTAYVIQEAHTIDPVTRTRIVRLSIDNSMHRLHPGLFVDVYFSFPTSVPILAVPESALMRGADGHWTLFVEESPGLFKAQEVELGRSFGQWREISGVGNHSRVVMKGAFFVASQIAKGGFDPHNH